MEKQEIREIEQRCMEEEKNLIKEKQIFGVHEIANTY